MTARPSPPDEILLGFTRALRAAGVPVTQDRRRASSGAPPWSVSTTGGRPTGPAARRCAPAPDDLDALRPGLRRLVRRPRRAAAAAARAPRRSRQSDAAPRTSRRAARRDDTTRTRPGRVASATEVLRHRDVAALAAAEKRRAGRDVRPAVAADRRSRRTARHRRWHRGEVDARARCATRLRRMGEPGDIAWRRRGTRPRRVVLLVDVSGSMSGYADALLRLAHRRDPAGGRGGVETFTVGTRLTHVTRALRLRDPDRALVAAGETVPDWSGGTRLGETLQVFLDRWGQRGMARGAVVVVFSDGWERGDPTLLGRADGPAAPDRAPGDLGEPAPRQGRLRTTAGWRGRRAAATATTSSPATRWRPSPT